MYRIIPTSTSLLQEERKVSLVYNQFMQLLLEFDGGSRGNPGPAAYGYVLKNGDEIIDQRGENMGKATNNQAEYMAVIEGLKSAKKHNATHVKVAGDSLLVIKQLMGEWKVKHPNMRELIVLAREIEKDFTKVEYKHVRREFNKAADALVNEALDRII